MAEKAKAYTVIGALVSGFAVVERLPGGGHLIHEQYAPKGDDLLPDLAEIAKDIFDGQYEDEIVAVLHIDLHAGTCRDAIREVAAAVRDHADKLRATTSITPELRDWLETHGATVWHTIHVEAA